LNILALDPRLSRRLMKKSVSREITEQLVEFSPKTWLKAAQDKINKHTSLE